MWLGGITWGSVKFLGDRMAISGEDDGKDIWVMIFCTCGMYGCQGAKMDAGEEAYDGGSITFEYDLDDWITGVDLIEVLSSIYESNG